MSSSTKAIVTKNSTINNNDRKRPLSSSARLSTSPTSAKRRGFSSSSSSTRPNHDETINYFEINKDRSQTTTEINDQVDFDRDSSCDFDASTTRIESSRFSTTFSQYSLKNNDFPEQYPTSNGSPFVYDSNKTIQQAKREGNYREHVLTKKIQANFVSNTQKSIDSINEPTYTKRSSSIAVLVKSTPSNVHDQRTSISNGDSDDETERIRSNSTSILNKSSNAVPSTLMTIVTGPDLSKKSLRTENNVIIQQIDGNVNVTSSTRVLKLVVPQSNNALSSSPVASPSIKMLSHGDGFTSALRVPTKIQLTKTSHASSQHGDKSSSVISSVSNITIHQEQRSLSPSSTSLIDIPIEMTEKQQQSIIDYPTSTTLPPTPPPPVVDQPNTKNTNKFSRLSNPIDQHQVEHEQEKQIRNLNSTKNIQDSERLKSLKISTNSTTTQRKANLLINDNSSSVSDWSVPPTSELSPTSITSSSPDVSNNVTPSDETLIDSESTNIPKSSLNSETRVNRSLSNSFSLFSSSSMCFSESNDSISKSFKQKSLTRLSNGSTNKTTSNDGKKSNNRTSKTKSASSPRLRRRRDENENFFVQQQRSKSSKSKIKFNQVQFDDLPIIQDLLNEMIEKVLICNETAENFNKVLIVPVQKIIFPMPADRSSNRKTPIKARGDVIKSRTSAITRKRTSLSQSLGSRVHNESRLISLKSKDMDESAFLLYASEHRSEFERLETPAVAEQRMQAHWSRMSNHDKRVYFTRVLEVYRRPHCETIIASTPIRGSFSEAPSVSTKLELDKSNTDVPVTVGSLQRQTSTPLSFHSVTSSINDEQHAISPHDSTSKTTIFADVVNELIKGGNGLDKLSCTLADFTNNINQFVVSPSEKRLETIQKFEEDAQKTCPAQLQRASLFWTEKVKYFASKHTIGTSDQSMNELTLIVKYFYLYVLSLMIQKQRDQQKNVFINLLNGKTSFDETYTSANLTSVIEDLILTSSLANDYLLSQPLIIGQIEHFLPFLRNIELENDLLNKHDNFLMNNLFSSLCDLEEYLNHCEHSTTSNIPYYPTQPVHHPSTYYPIYHNSPQYYYRSSSNPADMNSYYYNSSTPYSHAVQHYPYTIVPPYYHPGTSSNYTNNEQFQNYYYSSQPTSTAYSSPPNSGVNTMDIPGSHKIAPHRSHRSVHSDVARQYNKSQSLMASIPTPSTSTTATGFDGTAAMPPQSKPLNTIVTHYPP